jgi:hypothetical protein
MLQFYTKRVIAAVMPSPITVPDLIEKLTPAALIAALGVSDQAVSNMKQRNAIPPRHWPVVVELSKQHPDLSHVTWEYLVTLHRPDSKVLHRESTKRNHPRWQRTVVG